MIHNIVDNRESKREEKALDEKKRRKQAKTKALVEEKLDRGPKARSAYRRTKRDWLEAYEEDLELDLDEYDDQF